MTVDTDTKSGVITISGILDIDNANSLREAFLDSRLNRLEVSADLSAVGECDAAALQVLLAALRDAAAAGKMLRLTAVSNSVRDTAAALGFPIPSGVPAPGAEYVHAG